MGSAELVTVTVRADEAAELGDARCADPRCGHLLALHNTHCCQFCLVGDCPCERG
jgi:hypothetical protein